MNDTDYTDDAFEALKDGRLDDFVDRLNANADAYHRGTVTHAEFQAVNRGIWDEIADTHLGPKVVRALQPAPVDPNDEPDEVEPTLTMRDFQ